MQHTGDTHTAPRQSSIMMILVISILLALLSAFLWYLPSSHYHPVAHGKEHVTHNTDNMAATTHTATLTLANGQQLELSGENNEHLAVQGNTQLAVNNGVLSYNRGPQLGIAEAAAENKLTTSAGSSFTVSFSDGSQVSIGPSTTLTYPTRFTAARKEVTLDGEARFTVVADSSHPFVAGMQECQVISTQPSTVYITKGDAGKLVSVETGSADKLTGARITVPAGQQLTVETNVVRPMSAEAWKLLSERFASSGK